MKHVISVNIYNSDVRNDKIRGATGSNAPLARHGQKLTLLVLSRASQVMSHTGTCPPLCTKYSEYVFMVRNFINQILGELNTEPYMDNPHPDNREYAVDNQLAPESRMLLHVDLQDSATGE
jgi:hypothetical protein